MRRWAMALGVGALLLSGVAAEAQAWREGRGGGGYGQGRGQGRGRLDGGGYGRYGGGARGAGFQPVFQQPGGGYGRPPYGGPGYGGQNYGGQGNGGGYRRGQVLPPQQRGAYVNDPGRYHLRAAPPGYGWVGDGRNAYLTQRSTGLVLDSVPGAYEPAPQYRGGRRRGPR